LKIAIQSFFDGHNPAKLLGVMTCCHHSLGRSALAHWVIVPVIIGMALQVLWLDFSQVWLKADCNCLGVFKASGNLLASRPPAWARLGRPPPPPPELSDRTDKFSVTLFFINSWAEAATKLTQLQELIPAQHHCPVLQQSFFCLQLDQHLLGRGNVIAHWL